MNHKRLDKDDSQLTIASRATGNVRDPLPQQTPLTWTNELVERFWDYHAQFPNTYFTSQFGKGIVKSVRPYLKNDAKILDYACGIGGLLEHMLNVGLKVTACDLSPESLSAVEKKYKSHSNFLGTCTVSELRATNQEFDIIFLVELIEHVDDAILASILTDIKASLKPGGTLIVTTPNNENLEAETVFCPSCSHTFHRWQHVRSWNPSTLSAMLQYHNMQPVRIFATDFALLSQKATIQNCLRRIVRKIMRRPMPHLVAIATKTA